MALTDPLEPDEAMALPCYNDPGPWQDTVDRAELRTSAAKCRLACRQIAWCEQQRLLSVKLYGPATGTWAGRVWTERDYTQLPKCA